ncbi:MAG: hypothetical protein UW69_C0031G0001, partial [Microgenomates group bacterium GW2011_GWA2_44_7]
MFKYSPQKLADLPDQPLRVVRLSLMEFLGKDFKTHRQA